MSESTNPGRIAVGFLQLRVGEEVSQDEGAQGNTDGFRVGMGRNWNQFTKDSLIDACRM